MKLNKHTIITLIPFLMLLATALSGYLSHTKYYHTSFKYLGDSVGYSIITNVVFIFLYFRKSFCLQTKVAVIGLLLMNIISIIFKGRGWLYDGIYDLWISLIIGTVAFLTLIKWR